MKANIQKSAARIIVLLFISSLLIPFQNCSVYKSDGRKAFDSSLEEAANKGCYPYVDTNVAMDLLGVLDDSLLVYKIRTSGEDAYTCDFTASVYPLKHINCKVSVGSAELALLLKQQTYAVFQDAVSATVTGARTGFVGSTHGGYVTLDSDTLYTVKYLAVDGLEKKGVSCTARMTLAHYNANAAAVMGLINLTLEMAIQNKE